MGVIYSTFLNYFLDGSIEINFDNNHFNDIYRIDDESDSINNLNNEDIKNSNNDTM